MQDEDKLNFHDDSIISNFDEVWTPEMTDFVITDKSKEIATDRASHINFKLKPSKVDIQLALSTRFDTFGEAVSRKISKKLAKSIEGEKNEKGYIDLDENRDLPIKKAMSAYVLFGNERREAISKQHPEGMKVTEVVKIIAKEWSNMSKKQKQKYREMAKLDKIRFETELKQIVNLDDPI